MRAEKSSLVDEIKTKVDGYPYLIITDYNQMNVPQFSELRKRLRQTGARYTVVKNTILRIALKELNLPEIKDLLEGQTAIVSGSQDVCSAAKVLKNFSSEFSKPKIRGGILDGAVLKADHVKALADLPPRDVLLAQILSLINAPASTLVRLIHTPATQLGRVLQAKAEKAE